MRERVIDLDGPDLDTPDVPLDPIPPAARQVGLMAESVRAIYIGCRREMTGDADFGSQPMPQWDGGTDKFGARRQPIWPKIARQITEIGADPIEFVRAQFWAKKDGKLPKPNYLLSPEATARWDEYRVKAERDLRYLLKSDHTSVNGVFVTLTTILEWDDAKALDYALRDRTKVQASPLYRYCVAEAAGLHEASAIFYDRAVLQYVFQHRLYDEIWGDFVPGSLRNEASELRTRLALQ